MDCLPWWAISLLSIAVFLLLFLLFPKLREFLEKRNQICSKDSNPDTCNLQKCPNMVKKDLSHFLILFIIVLAFLISGPLYKDEMAMDFFSFASTISSIILSVVAIIFSITGETRTEGLKRVLGDTTSQLDSAMGELGRFHESIKKQLELSEQILVELGNLEKNVNEMKDGMLPKNQNVSLSTKDPNENGGAWQNESL